MNLLQEIAEVVKDDREHHVEVKVNSFGVTVYLINDPLNDYFEDYIVPVTYSTLEEYCYIPRNELFEKFKDSHTGIVFEEIVLIKKIMEYLKNNKEEINKLCEQFNWDDRFGEDTKIRKGENEESHFPID